MNPVPAHLVPEVEALERGDMDYDLDRRLELYGALVAANAVPFKDQADVTKAIETGWLSPSGDVQRDSGDGYRVDDLDADLG